ncbi:MAG: hypothetical protein ACK5EA_16035 [Planctomycetaceae bacterium]
MRRFSVAWLLVLVLVATSLGQELQDGVEQIREILKEKTPSAESVDLAEAKFQDLLKAHPEAEELQVLRPQLFRLLAGKAKWEAAAGHAVANHATVLQK